MYWRGQQPNEVATMIGRLLRIAYISTEQARAVDKLHKHTMPNDWDSETGSILVRLEIAGISIEDAIETT